MARGMSKAFTNIVAARRYASSIQHVDDWLISEGEKGRRLVRLPWIDSLKHWDDEGKGQLMEKTVERYRLYGCRLSKKYLYEYCDGIEVTFYPPHSRRGNLALHFRTIEPFIDGIGMGIDQDILEWDIGLRHGDMDPHGLGYIIVELFRRQEASLQ